MSAAVFLQQVLRLLAGIVMAAAALRTIICAIGRRKASGPPIFPACVDPCREGPEDLERILRLSATSRFRQEEVLRRMRTIAGDIAAWERERQGYASPPSRGRRWVAFGVPGVVEFLASDPFSLDSAPRRRRCGFRDPEFSGRLAEAVAAFEERMSSRNRPRKECSE